MLAYFDESNPITWSRSRTSVAVIGLSARMRTTRTASVRPQGTVGV
jgi:hypothetical protein